MHQDSDLVNHPGFTVIRTLTYSQARLEAEKTLAYLPKGTGRVVEAECNHTGTKTYHLAIAWRAGRATHKHCCKVQKSPHNAGKVAPQTPTEASVSLYSVTKDNRAVHLGSQGTLKGLWHRNPPTTNHLRLDIHLFATGEVFTAHLEPAHVAVIRWWMNLEKNPTIWVDPPDLQSLEDSQAPAADAPPRVLPFSLIGGLGPVHLVDISTDPPTHISVELRAWLLMRLHEHSYALTSKVPVPEYFGDTDGDARGQAIHSVRHTKWPEPVDPKPQDAVLRYQGPKYDLKPVRFIDLKGQDAALYPSEEGAFEVLRRPRQAEWLPKARHLASEFWDLSDLEEVPVIIPEHWEKLALWKA